MRDRSMNVLVAGNWISGNHTSDCLPDDASKLQAVIQAASAFDQQPFDEATIIGNFMADMPAIKSDRQSADRLEANIDEQAKAKTNRDSSQGSGKKTTKKPKSVSKSSKRVEDDGERQAKESRSKSVSKKLKKQNVD